MLTQKKIDKRRDELSEEQPALQGYTKEAEDTNLNIVQELISLGLGNQRPSDSTPLVALILAVNDFYELSTREENEIEEGDVGKRTEFIRVYKGMVLVQQRDVPKALSLNEQLEELLIEEEAEFHKREPQYSRCSNELEEKAYERHNESFLHAVKGVVNLYDVYTCPCDKCTPMLS